MTVNKFTIEEVSRHKTAGNCWIIVHNNVYNVSKYIYEHPPGKDIILENAGKDVSDKFEEFHLDDTWEFLKTFKIGEIIET